MQQARSRPASLLALCGALMLASQFVTGPAGAAVAAPLQGEWAGDRLRLAFDASGGMVETDCASGMLRGPVTVAGDGSFAATGTFWQHGGGPQRADEAATSAQYAGRVQDGIMTLSILPAGAPVPQVFRLQQGGRIKLIRCL